MRQLEEIKPIKEIVLAKLRTDIISGRYKPGQRLIERELAEQMNVSRTPVREALSKLEQEKLVTTTSYKGVIVTELSLKEVRDIFECRIALEALVAKLAAKNATAIELEHLERIVEAARTDHGTEALIGFNSDFHKLIAQASHNERLLHMLVSLQTQISLLRVTSLSVEGRPVANLEEHRDIFRAIKNRRPEVAEAMMKNHIELVGESIYSMITQKK